ncbi:Late secretory pathway protein AVL9 [Orchesella cincta]|uniref:Late secretory pathway protein AVL9 n=1 Tax=Orchesella cincta TaxID=48709 RepID=A0A1D2MIJ4_ORCCI|nr:Late secretory pathway protein AVL9 [Orchesella cincta]
MGADSPIYHVVVVGFHHKKGCQVEYVYPPFEMDLEKTAWKHLTSLAMPDGAHNFETDTVYFHLPSLKNPRETVFGVACYQQIDASKLTNKPDDVTRSKVQKSVCVLSRFPLYGHIQVSFEQKCVCVVKMSLITAAYFKKGDFEQVSILKEGFSNLNLCLSAELLKTPEACVGLSPRDLVFNFRHQIITLFKLLLLEKRILFRGASVGPLCSSLLTLVSLLPLTLEYGLTESACIKTNKAMSIVPQFSTQSADVDPTSIEMEEKIDSGKECTQTDIPKETSDLSDSSSSPMTEKKAKNLNNARIQDGVPGSIEGDTVDHTEAASGEEMEEMDIPTMPTSKFYYSLDADTTMKTSLSEASSLASEKQADEIPDFITAVQMTPSDAGLPLQLFTKGYLCHPYLSLHYMDLLSDSRVRGFVVGATNILFKQKRDLVDVVVEMSDGSVDIFDSNLKRLVTATTADLRFADTIVRQVTQESGLNRAEADAFMDGVGWEGGDEWIRAQFKYYLMCLMRTSLLVEGSRQRESFCPNFIREWQSTHNWKTWEAYVNSDERDTPGIYSICPGHPNDGNISVSDMKIRLSHTMQSSESGRKIKETVASTGKAVGGAISQAKGAFSTWWSSVTTGIPVATTPDSIPPETGETKFYDKPATTTPSQS